MPKQGLELHPPPLSLPGCFKQAWTQVLFPGTAPGDTRLRWPALVLLVLLPGALLYPCLSFHLFEPDEGRYAEISREMLQRGEWVVPYLQSEPYLDKPPLLYWLVMGSYRLLGVHDWAARLAPALAVHGCLLLVYLLGRRSLGERAAFWGALFLGLAPGFLCMGRLLVLDGLLAFWVTLALLAGFEAVRQGRLRWGWWLTGAGACGLGVLTKGPVALVLFMPPLWLHCRLGPAACPVPRRAWLAFLGIVLTVALPWYVAICLRLPAFARYFLWDHNVVRFLAPFDHLEPVWYYTPILLGGFLPGTLLLPSLVRWLLSREAEVRARRCPGWATWSWPAAGVCCSFPCPAASCRPTCCRPFRPWRSSWAISSPAAAGTAPAGWPGWRPRPSPSWPSRITSLFPGTPGIAPRPASLGAVHRFCADPATPIICFPRPCDSVAFYLGRSDLRSFRSKQIDQLRAALRRHPRTVVLCTHRHSLQGLKQALPPELRVSATAHFGLGKIPGLPDTWTRQAVRLAGETPWGLCDVAVVVRRDAQLASFPK